MRQYADLPTTSMRQYADPLMVSIRQYAELQDEYAAVCGIVSWRLCGTIRIEQ